MGDKGNSSVRDVKADIAQWAVDSKIESIHVDSLLKILRFHYDDSLPATYRTLCQTPRKSNVLRFDDVKSTYKYFGIENHLRSYVESHKIVSQQNPILLNFNLDGVPISSSSNSSLWPVLMNIEGCKKICIVICHCGPSKPLNITLYLREFCEELQHLLAYGFICNNAHFSVRVRSFPCDAPARAFALNIYGHAGRNPCHKCKIVGKYHNHRQTFMTLDNEPRTAEEFIMKSDILHYHGPSPFDELKLDIPKIFVVDYMHAVLLGVVKTLILLWIFDRKKPYSIPLTFIREMNKLQERFAACLPREFSRETRSFLLTKRFKATEFRTLLLYSLPILLKNRLPQKYYSHFMLLHCAMRILCHPNECLLNLTCAKNLINDFVGSYARLYSQEQMSYNVHSLLHLCDDVEFIGGPLDTFSCFKFENYLQTLKRLPRTGYRVLEQIANRIVEHSFVNTQCEPSTSTDPHKHMAKIDIGDAQSTIYFNGLTLSNRSPNNYCVINYENVGLSRIEEIFEDGQLEIRRVLKCVPIFRRPINSELLSTCVIANDKEENTLSSETIRINISPKTKKACHFDIGSTQYFIEMIN